MPRPYALTLLLLSMVLPISPARAEPTLIKLRPGLGEGLAQSDRAPAVQRLGIRASLVKRARIVIPDVVIVEDEASYLSAISAWTPGVVFPVLWDDGSVRSAEDISRFVRAFNARSVVRFRAADSANPGPREASIRAAWASAVGAAPSPEPSDALRLQQAQGITPPGLVITSMRDPAWPGALALGAGRFQPIRFIDKPRGSVSAALSQSAGEALAKQIETFAEESGLSWKAQGDDLDAITLCIDGPIKIKTADQPRTFVALTDRIGRLGAGGAGERWAWSGQITGPEPVSAYRAMCALFLETTSAWLFDAYPPTAEWAAFDANAAAALLRKRDIATIVHDTPNQGKRDWRLGALRPLEAGLVMVNSKGNVDFFDLAPGRGAPGDIPFLSRPAIVHFVHSWSLARAGDRNTVGGRWLERGAYAYLGSVQEPYLQSFMPTPSLASRLLAGLPWGAAVRVDAGPVWKLAVLGDPLITISPAGVRADAPLPLGSTSPISSALTEMLAENRFSEAVRALVLVGRDEDAARLARGLLKDRPDELDETTIINAIPALMRTGEHESVLRLARVLPDIAAHPFVLDSAWQSARVLIATRRGNGSALAFMQSNIRKAQLVRDADEIALALKPSGGARGASAYVNSLIPRAANERQRKSLERMAAEFASGKR